MTKDDGAFAISLQDIPRDELPEGDVLIRVAYSSLNYKDGLAVTGRPGVIRRYPMIPGIDLAGAVEESSVPEFQPGDDVVVTGCGTSETFWGGYSQMARLKAEHVVPVPEGMSLVQAMGIGTAGFTAMQAVMALEQQGVQQEGRDVLVTGASGGVGSVTVAILSKLRYRVVASSGRPELYGYLRKLGASDIVDRSALAAPKKPLESERWGGAIDSVGGDALAGLLPAMAVGASVASCGVAGGSKLETTVFPFILRGVNILGINSLYVSRAERLAVWERLKSDLRLDLLDSILQVAPLSDVIELGGRILEGKIRGRTVIDVNQ